MRKKVNFSPELTPVEQVKNYFCDQNVKNVFNKTEERVLIMNEFDFKVAN